MDTLKLFLLAVIMALALASGGVAALWLADAREQERGSMGGE